MARPKKEPGDKKPVPSIEDISLDPEVKVMILGAVADRKQANDLRVKYETLKEQADDVLLVAMEVAGLQSIRVPSTGTVTVKGAYIRKTLDKRLLEDYMLREGWDVERIKWVITAATKSSNVSEGVQFTPA